MCVSARICLCRHGTETVRNSFQGTLWTQRELQRSLGGPQMYVVLEVIRAVTWHSNVPACSADVGQLTSVSHCSSTRTSLAAIFILITTPIITRDYSNISERTHPHTIQLTVMLWLRYSAPYGFLGGFWGRICMFLAFQWKALKKPA